VKEIISFLITMVQKQRGRYIQINVVKKKGK